MMLEGMRRRPGLVNGSEEALESGGGVVHSEGASVERDQIQELNYNNP